MDDVARSVLSTQELATFNYYLDQYEHKGLPIEDLVTPLLDLFDTAEKVSLSLVIAYYYSPWFSARIAYYYSPWFSARIRIV